MKTAPIFVCVLLFALLVACSASSPTATPEPIGTPFPTNTPQPTTALALGYRTISSAYYYYAEDVNDCSSLRKSYGEIEQATTLEATDRTVVCNGETLVELRKPPSIISSHRAILIPERFLERVDGYSLPPTTRSPMPTGTEVECVGDKLILSYEAYVDANGNGRREPEEEPLKGVLFRMTDQGLGGERTDKAVSDKAGQASIDKTGRCSGPSEFHVEAPPGFQLTTSKGSGWCDRKPCSFGFAVQSGTPGILSQADLRKADLKDANLIGADLSEADLSEVNLSNALLTGASLGKADLSRAKLVGADLREADLTGANLSGANLSNTWLIEADLGGANLGEADLNEADLRWTNLRGADLRLAKNLSNADLHSAKYDHNTKWPDDFDPLAAGAVLEE